MAAASAPALDERLGVEPPAGGVGAASVPALDERLGVRLSVAGAPASDGAREVRLELAAAPVLPRGVRAGVPAYAAS